MSNQNAPIAWAVNHNSRPLLISNGYGRNTHELLALSYGLDPRVQLILIVDRNVSQLPTDLAGALVFLPSEALSAELKRRGFTLSEVQKSLPLYRLEAPQNVTKGH